MSTNRAGNREDLFQDLAYGIERDAFLDDVGRACARNAALGCADEFVREVIHSRVNYLRVQELFGVAVPFRLPCLSRGNLFLGQDWVGAPVPLWTQTLCSGLLLAGTTGSGKTSLLTCLAPQLPRCGAQIWLFETYKTQLRHLRPVFQRLGHNLVVLQASDLRLNPLHPGRRDPRRQLATSVDLLNRIIDVGDRGQNILWQTGHALYDKFGVWTGRSGEAPCLFDVYEHVRETSGLNAAARDAILDRLGSVLAFGSCFAYRVGWDPVELEKFSIVFEMRGLPEHVTRLVIEPSLYTVFQDAYDRGAVNAPLSLVMVVEDSLRLFAGRTWSASGLAPLEEALAASRGSGKTVWPIVQGVHSLSRSLVANLNTKIMGVMGSADDYQSLGADMRLSAEQLLWAKRNLQPGILVAQINQGEWREPFVLRVPHLKLTESVSDAAAADSTRALAGLPTVAAKEYASWRPHHVITVTAGAPKAASSLTEVELRYLKLVVAEPGKPSSYYAKLAGLNGTTAAAVRARLVTLGFVREHAVATGRRGRMASVLEPLEKTKEVV